MAKSDLSLDHLRIAAPCTADWDQMPSFNRDRVRFCSQCNLNVYNLSAMTRDEATALVYQTEGRLCVSFYRRSDGSILTENCPVGLRAIKRRAEWLAQVLLGMLVTALSAVGLSGLIVIRKSAHMAGGIADRYIPLEELEKSAPIVTTGVVSRPPAKKVKTLIQKRKANAKRRPKL
jgi:hypothetical protein